jgi:hypothetical protein
MFRLITRNKRVSHHPPAHLNPPNDGDMSTQLQSDMNVSSPHDVRDEPRNPLIGMVGFMAAFASIGAVFVAVTRHEPAVVAQLGIAGAACGAIAGLMASAER